MHTVLWLAHDAATGDAEVTRLDNLRQWRTGDSMTLAGREGTVVVHGNEASFLHNGNMCTIAVTERDRDAGCGTETVRGLRPDGSHVSLIVFAVGRDG